ncbi:MAG: hypothetical protein ACOYJ6_03345 [Caulobacterales bacterium]|jgi:hypothetical protein
MGWRACLAAALVWCAGAMAQTPSPGAFAARAYTTPLSPVCPNPLVIQTDWLAQAEHGGLYQLIGAGGRAERGRYTGPLGKTGIELILLQGGAGIGLGDGETAYSALYMGNSRARLRPHLALHDLDNLMIFSGRFPAIGVVAMLETSPIGLFWDQATYPKGFRTRADLAAFAKSGQGKIYVSTTRRTFARYLVASGVAKSAFVEGYRGDSENFVLNNGRWLNQGSLTNEAYQFAHGRKWNRPIGHIALSQMGYDIYPSVISVAANRITELSPCLARLAPLLQRAQIDYVRNPGEVNDLLFRYNQAGLAAPFWKTSRALLDNAVRVQIQTGIVGNGPNTTLGDFDMARVERVAALLRPMLDIRAKPNLRVEDVVTNRFIDPAIGMP